MEGDYMTSYLDKYLDDLYKLKISIVEVSRLEGISRVTVDRELKRRGLISPRGYYKKINTGNAELDLKMKQRYNSIVTRCNGNNNNKHHHKHYKGLDYLPIYEWVDFCDINKETLLDMWEVYDDNNHELRLAISVDRIDNDKGYTVDNMQFVTHGLNAWKRNITPLSVTHNGKTRYFMSGEEAGNYYGIRTQSISDILRGQKRLIQKDYQPNWSNKETVLSENNVGSLDEYYDKVFVNHHVSRKDKRTS